MTPVLVLRHAPTAWNEAGRLQGRADPPLSPAGRARLARWRLPAAFATAALVTSPLRRARETAARFGSARIDARLIEMDWGAWEGRRLADLRAADPAAMAAAEARGLDLRPPAGESPREVAARLADLLAELHDATVLVAHKGQLRAAMALATGWTMQDRPPLRLGPDDALGLTLAAGRPTADLERLPLIEEPG